MLKIVILAHMLRIEIDNLESFQQELINKDYKYFKLSIEKTEWETLEMEIKDPFGNRLIFSTKTIIPSNFLYKNNIKILIFN